MPRIKSGWVRNKTGMPLRVGQMVRLLEGVGEVLHVNDCGATVAVGGHNMRISRCSQIEIWVERGKEKQHTQEAE